MRFLSPAFALPCHKLIRWPSDVDIYGSPPGLFSLPASLNSGITNLHLKHPKSNPETTPGFICRLKDLQDLYIAKNTLIPQNNLLKI